MKLRVREQTLGKVCTENGTLRFKPEGQSVDKGVLGNNDTMDKDTGRKE